MEHTPCACAVIGHRTVNIEYCPLHAAALELLKALKEAQSVLDTLRATSMLGPLALDIAQAEIDARAAIKATKGDA